MAKKNDVLERLRKKLTPEYLEKRKLKRLEEKKSLTSEWQFGFYVGEDIYHSDLPTISIEAGTRKVVSVSEEDELEYKSKERNWFDKCHNKNVDVKEEWNSYQECRKRLIKKYLPNPLKCYRPLLNITNMNEFKEGLINSLWNTDVCNYNLNPENIKIYDEDDAYFTVIELELDKDENT